MPLSKSIGKWIANTEATTTGHHIFTVKQNHKRNGRTLLHSHIIFHTLCWLSHISWWTQLFYATFVTLDINRARSIFSSLMMPLIGESLGFFILFFKQQFKSSWEQFYITNCACWNRLTPMRNTSWITCNTSFRVELIWFEFHWFKLIF